MKTFLDTWLLEAPVGLSQELAGTVKLVPSGQLPETEGSLCCQIEVAGGMRGSFWIVIDAGALARVLVEARVVEAHVAPEGPDSGRDAQLWQDILRQVAARAAKAAGKEAGAPVTIAAILTAQRPAGLALAAYEMRFGELTARVAFADQTRTVAAEARSQMDGAAGTALPARGLELLLDVELEASLRFGSREMRLSEVLELGPGDVVQLERHVSDPVDLIVGDKIVAKGEVVLVNGNFGLRVTEVAEPKKSLESIRCLF